MKKISVYLQRAPYLLLAIIFFSLQDALNGQEEKKYNSIIEKYSNQYGVDNVLVKSLILISSGGNPKAVSSSGAAGLLQLTPDVVKNLGIKNPYDAEQNIQAGCKYLKSLLNQFGNTELAVAAFNAGPGEVQKYGKVPPYPETKKFVDAVMKKYKSLQKETSDSDIIGSWNGTGRYTKYNSKPPLPQSIVGVTQPFDLQINPHETGIIISTSKGIMGDPSLYRNLKVDKNSLHVEYSGPNPFGVAIPNSQTKNTMSYVLDVAVDNGTMKGVFSAVVVSKVEFNIPDLKLPGGSAEIEYSLSLNLKKK